MCLLWGHASVTLAVYIVYTSCNVDTVPFYDFFCKSMNKNWQFMKYFYPGVERVDGSG